MFDSSDPVTLPDDVLRAVGAGVGVERVELTGSRAREQASPLSDWDFAVVTTDFDRVRDAMPRIVVPLRPVVARRRWT